MKPAPPPPDDPVRGPFTNLVATAPRGPLSRLRAYFFAGVLVAAPIGITIGLSVWMIDLVDNRILPSRYNPDNYLPFRVPGFGILIVVTGLTFIGWLTSNFAGRAMHAYGERLVDRIPVIRSIYGATKQIAESVLAQKSKAFREVALIEYPRKGIWSIGFLTGTTAGEGQARTNQETVNVFLPTTPNPTSGYLLFVPRQDVIVLDMTVEDGIKMVVSGGIVTPPFEPPDAPAIPAPEGSGSG